MTDPASARGAAWQQARAPELAASEWFNTASPISLAALIGRPVFLQPFQALCQGNQSDAKGKPLGVGARQVERPVYR